MTSEDGSGDELTDAGERSRHVDHLDA
jgi:hypothetical protein